jgi:DNA replication protein DnaC
MSTTSCKGCGATIEYEPLKWFTGRTSGWAPGYCEGCTDHREREAEELAEEVRRQDECDALLRRIRQSGLPPSRQRASFDSFPASPLCEAAEAFAAGTLAGLWIFGLTGRGKTELAAAACMGRLQHSPIDWVRVPNLISQLAADFGEDVRSRALAVVTGSGAVVLDDLDGPNSTGNTRSQLHQLVDNRVEAEAPLLVTTNADPEGLRRLGDPLASRLVGYCRTFEMTGVDRRLERAVAA